MLCLLIRLLFVASAIAKNDDVNNRKLPALKSGKSSFVSRVTRSTISTRNNDDKNKGKAARVTLALSQNERVVLDLEPDMDLLSSDYEEVEITASGQRNVLKKLKDMDVCWFKGKIEGDPNSRVAVTDCGGNFEGLIKRGNGKHFIAKAVGDEGDVAVYASEDEEPAVGTCGAVLPSSPSRRLLLHEHSLPPAFSGLVDGLSHHHEGEHVHDDDDDNDEATLKQYFGESSPSSAAKRNLLLYSANTDMMEIATVSDFKYLSANGGAAAVALRNIQVLSIVRTMYENAEFTRATSLQLKAQYFFSTADPYTLTANAEGQVTAMKLLEAFTSWATNKLSAMSLDNIHLLTSHTFDSTTVGLAYIGTACNPSYKTGLTQVASGVTSTANIMAHELGHNLGMEHDGDSTAAECPSSGSMMGPYMDTCPRTGICPISSCSRAAKNKYTATVSCLQTWTEPTCTDKMLNGDESGIDCGGSSCVACPGQGPLFAPTTRMPTTRPTKRPTNAPTVRPTRLPTFRPTRKPTLQPTTRPTRTPSRQPTRRPTRLPTARPTRKPTLQPTTRPTRIPSRQPTRRPTRLPTARPTRKPTFQPTRPTR